jgi:translation elongation factor EF-1alpha
MEFMDPIDNPWEDINHHVYFLPNLERLEVDIENSVSTNNVEWYQSPTMMHDVYSEKNLNNNLKSIPINISIKPNVLEHILISAYCSP